jgi:hypothetical protein
MERRQVEPTLSLARQGSLIVDTSGISHVEHLDHLHNILWGSRNRRMWKSRFLAAGEDVARWRSRFGGGRSLKGFTRTVG